MATFKEARKALFHCNSLNLIDDEEFLLLYDANKSKNPDIPYSQYEYFDLDSMADDECMSEFRFLKNDIYRLLEVLDLPSKVRFPSHFLLTMLKLFASS